MATAGAPSKKNRDVFRACSQLNPRDVAQTQELPFAADADNDVTELLRSGEPPPGLNGELDLLVLGDRSGADPPDRRLHVLAADCRDHVVRGEPEPCQPVGLERDPHRIILGAEHHRLADAGRPLQAVQHGDGDEVRDRERVERAIGRVEGDELQDG